MLVVVSLFYRNKKPTRLMKKLFLLTFLLIPLFTQAQTFLSLQIEDLTFKNGQEIPQKFDVKRNYSRELRKWINPPVPYLRTSDAKRSFIHIVSHGNNPTNLPTGALRICLVNPKPIVNGSLFIPNKDNELSEHPFTFNRKNAKNLTLEKKGEVPYLKNKLAYYQKLQKLSVPGTAWFRHQSEQASNRLKKLLPKDEHKHQHNLATRNFRPRRRYGFHHPESQHVS